MTGDVIPYAGDVHRSYSAQPQVNDAPANSYLYAGGASVGMGLTPGGLTTAVTITDLPHETTSSRTRFFSNTKGGLNVSYEVNRFVYNYDFEDFLVVEVTNSNASKPQYVPLRKVKWKLHIDSTAADPAPPAPPLTWKCEAVGTDIAPTKPTDGSATTSNTSTPDQEGAPLDFRKP